MLQNERRLRCLSKFIMIFSQEVMKYSMGSRWQSALTEYGVLHARALQRQSIFSYTTLSSDPPPSSIFSTYFCTYFGFSFRFYDSRDIFHYFPCSRSYWMSILQNANIDFASMHSIHRFASSFLFVLFRGGA